MTKSAQAHSASLTWRTFRSTNLNSHSWGKIAATVTKPNGGSIALRSSKAKVFSKDQKLFGNRGYRSKTFIEFTKFVCSLDAPLSAQAAMLNVAKLFSFFFLDLHSNKPTPGQNSFQLYPTTYQTDVLEHL
jgi:hypothetical protein